MLDAFRARMGIKRHNHPIDLLAEANGLLSGIALYPQVFKALTTRHVADLAPSTFFIMFVTNLIWFAYAVHRRALPIIIASIMNILAAGTLVVLFFVFKNGG
ncbi:hypothetical protein EDM68_00160 [Candidatus Uhrbacteria bacterium]|nr:MAG: hypothetical protein EDM68_00160 [Candidatus Uhrbacteria bacterium]